MTFDEWVADVAEADYRACERGDVCVVCRHPDHACECLKVSRLPYLREARPLPDTPGEVLEFRKRPVSRAAVLDEFNWLGGWK